jgi:hypothetical protein
MGIGSLLLFGRMIVCSMPGKMLSEDVPEHAGKYIGKWSARRGCRRGVAGVSVFSMWNFCHNRLSKRMAADLDVLLNSTSPRFVDQGIQPP